MFSLICPFSPILLLYQPGIALLGVNFDGPSVPSENCCSSMTVLFGTNLSFSIFSLFYHILSYFIGLCIWNCHFRKSTLLYLSETLYLSNRWLESTISDVCCRRNSQIRTFMMGHQCHQRTVICLDFVSICYIYFLIYFSLIFSLFSHILSDFIGLCIWNCLFRKSTAPLFINFNRDTIFMTWINHLWGLGQEKQQDQCILMGHQCHHRTVAPPAPQPLGQFLSSLWKPHSNTPL